MAVNESIPTITSNNIEVILEDDSTSQVVYNATSNIADASYSLIDQTIYPTPIDTAIIIPEMHDQTQHVYVSETQISQDESQVAVTVSHNASGSLLGLGLRIHFDSTVLTLSDINDVLQANLIAAPIVDVLADTSNLDGDAATDSYVIASWAAVSDAAWTLDYPDVLATFTFDIEDQSAESSVINFSSSGTTAGYDFAGQAQNVALTVEIPPESGVTIPEVQSATQHVYVSQSTKSEDGTQETVVISYNSDASNLTGLGLKVYFDSSVLSVESLTNVFSESNLFSFEEPASDVSDDDGDASTDMYLTLAWASAESDWPGALPIDLASVTFNILDQEVGSSALNFVSNGTPAGYAFEGLSHDVIISVDEAPPLAIDSATGVVTLTGELDYSAVPNYNFIVTAANEADSVSKDVDLLVVTESLEGQFSYSGTSVDDFVHVKNPSAGSSIASGPGNDVMLLDDVFGHSDILLLEDFESGIDSIDASLSIISLGYTSLSSDGAQSAQDGSLRVMRDIDPLSDEILAIVSSFSDSPDSNDFDNAFFSYFDQDVNQFNLVADLDPSSGITYLDRIAISLDDGVLVDDDDVTFNFIS